MGGHLYSLEYGSETAPSVFAQKFYNLVFMLRLREVLTEFELVLKKFYNLGDSIKSSSSRCVFILGLCVYNKTYYKRPLKKKTRN